MIKIGVNGAMGRMGQRIIALAGEERGVYQVVQIFDLQKAESLAPYAKGEKKLTCDVLIDFSGPEGASASAAAAQLSKKAVVIGSTGLDKQRIEAVEKAAKDVPVVMSSNMSVGVNVTIQLLEEACKKLPETFDIQITEAHHIHKKDAPSGTALMLASAIAAAKDWGAARAQKEKDRIKSIREGEIVGDHTVFFVGPDETVEITHRAHSRDIFARGALLAAKFAASAKPGRLYSMRDVLK